MYSSAPFGFFPNTRGPSPLRTQGAGRLGVIVARGWGGIVAIRYPSCSGRSIRRSNRSALRGARDFVGHVFAALSLRRRTLFQIFCSKERNTDRAARLDVNPPC